MEDHIPVSSEMPEPLRPQPSGVGLIRGFLGTVKAVLLSPHTFFPGMPVEGGLLGPYFFFLLCTGLFFLVFSVVRMREVGSFEPAILLMMSVALATPFVSAALLYLFLTKLLGTRGSYEATFRVVCYASAVNLLAWIPIFVIGILLQFYEVYLSALGLSVVHQTSMGKALLAVIGTAFAIFLTILLGGQAILVF